MYIINYTEIKYFYTDQPPEQEAGILVVGYNFSGLTGDDDNQFLLMWRGMHAVVGCYSENCSRLCECKTFACHAYL